MEVVYLTPEGKPTHEGLRPESLQTFAESLPQRHPNDELARLLADIINEIYGR